MSPDVEELIRYNREAKQLTCNHSNARRIESDDGRWYYICETCGKTWQ